MTFGVCIPLNRNEYKAVRMVGADKYCRFVKISGSWKHHLETNYESIETILGLLKAGKPNHDGMKRPYESVSRKLWIIHLTNWRG